MSKGGISPTYMRRLLADLGWFLLIVLLGIEALFITDKLLTSLLLVALEHGLGADFLLRTALSALPEILFLGIPLAVGIAVYFVLLQRREAGDFVILSQVGFAPGSILGLTLSLGAFALALSIVIGGGIRPHAEHKLHQSLHEGRFAVLSSGDFGGRTQLDFDGATIIFHRDLASQQDARVFIHRSSSAQELQIITARDSQLTFPAPGADGQLRLSLAEIAEFETSGRDGPRLKLSMAAEQVLITGDTLVIPAFRQRQLHASTMTLQELILRGPDRYQAETQTILRIAMGGALALLSPLIAACALGMTRGRLALLAGPAGVGLVLVGGFAVAPLSGWLSGFALGPGLALIFGTALALVLVASAFVLWLGDALLTPAQIRL